ncbi:MAG: flagellar export protein FliJ [Methyloligellaceae bacterium]
MKSREALIKLRRFEVDEKRQKVADIEVMISEFMRMLDDLDRQIKIEQERAGVSDINHYAYPTFAKAAMQRKDNLASSIDDLQNSLENAKDELANSYEELKKIEMLEERGIAEERDKRDKREQIQLDEFAAKPQFSI